MSDQVEIAGIGLLVVFVQGIFALLNQRNHRQTQASVETVRQDVNGKMEKMQEVIKTAAIAEGKLAGKAEEKAHPS